MKLTIDNLAGQGPVDYTATLDATVAPCVERRLNQPAALRCSLLANAGFVVPATGGRVVLEKTNGAAIFTGYLSAAPELEYLGWGEGAPVYRYNLMAESDEVLLDMKPLPNRAPFVNRTAGSALTQLVQDLMPGGFDTSGVAAVDTLAVYEVNPQKKFSFHAGQIALAARASYRAINGALLSAPVGAATYALNETDANFTPAGLKLASQNMVANDVTVMGLDEPQDYVRDYFVGDGLTTRFYLSQTPFAQEKQALIDEEYLGPGLDATTWTVIDPKLAISVVEQTLQVSGGTGGDGQTTVSFVEQMELGGALELQHGDVSFTAASQGILGGLYAGAVSTANCVAGFQITPSGTGSNIQALIQGAATGPVVATTAGHRYVLTTYLYSMEVYRSEETFHSSLHPAGNGVGGATVPANVRVVLVLQDIDPSDAATLVAPGTVLVDEVIANAPGFCTYALVNAMNMQCSIAYTYASHISLAEVRTAVQNTDQTYGTYVTQLVGPIADGCECEIESSTTLDFFPAYVPALNTLIVASYRGSGRAAAEVVNVASVASLQKGADNGVRGVVRTVKVPSARTQTDCENAALAILDDAIGPAWAGTYETWSDYLPGNAPDIFPGDGLTVDAPSRCALFSALVRRVTIDFVDPADDRGMYTIEFANDLALPLAMQTEATATTIPLGDEPPRLMTTQIGAYYLENLTEAQITEVSSTTVQVDAGMAPAAGWGIEVRANDYGWGVANDRNLLGRFSTQTFGLPRLERTENYFLRLYDSSSPPKYSRYSAALHVDYPL